jgi:hypothetical protein
MEVQIYEAVMEDSDGALTYTLLRAARYRKDNRLLPAGFAKATASGDVVPSADALADGNFLGGSDEVLYRVNRAGRAGPFTVSARLLYQTIGYAFAADLLVDRAADPAVAAFATQYDAAEKAPVVIAAFEVTAGADPPPAGLVEPRLSNLSTRAQVGPGDAPAIAGFVVSGSEPMPVLLRAVGPTLGQAPFNVSGALGDPSLAVLRAGVLVAGNTGIASAANGAAIVSAAQQAGAFALGPTGRDSALLLTLPSGAYTAVVSSATGGSGIVLVELYMLSAVTSDQKLINISTRAVAGSGENALIAGFVLSGSASRRVLVRAVGPGLASFGVVAALAQPTLTLYHGSQVLAANTNWTTSAEAAALPAAAAGVGAFALAAGDSALIATLVPGAYTAQVSGPAAGVALIEVYDLP